MQPGAEQPGSPAHSRENARQLFRTLIAAVVLYICFFSHLAALGLVGPDEPRYASVARAMAENGDWVTPRLDGHPWFEKPVLYYWGAALSFRAFGVNEFSARLPSALAALVAAVALAWTALRLYGDGAARFVLLIFPTCVGVFAFARAATPDMLFSASLALAMTAAHAAIAREERGGFASLLAFGVFLAAATLAKGPASLLLAGGSILLWAVVTRRWRAAFRLAHPLAVAAFCVVALPWYALCARRNPGFVRAFLFEHNLERYVTPVFRHEQPFWFFGPVLLLGLLPWTLLLVGVAGDGLRRWREKQWASSPGFFFACWAILPVLFFSFSKSKLPGYVLPAFPPLALLLARSTSARGETSLSRRVGMAGVGFTFVALAASAGHWLKRLPAESSLSHPSALFPWILVMGMGGLVVALGALLRRPVVALPAALLMAVLIQAGTRRVLPKLDPYLSPREAAGKMAFMEPEGRERVSVYRLHRAWHYGLNFYLHRELPEWNPQAPRPGWVYTSAAGLAELQHQGVRMRVVARDAPQATLVRVDR